MSSSGWLSLDQIAEIVHQPEPAEPDDPLGCPWLAFGYCWLRPRDPCPRDHLGPAPGRCKRHLGRAP